MKPVCTGPECDRPTHAKGLCSAHYWQHRQRGEMWPLGAERPSCRGPECAKEATARGLCHGHWQQWRAGTPLAVIRRGRSPREVATEAEWLVLNGSGAAEVYRQLHLTHAGLSQALRRANRTDLLPAITPDHPERDIAMHRLRHSINATVPMPGSQPDSWLEQAACRGRDPELFFSNKADDKAKAQAICGDCIVRKTCLAGALERGERHGIWGGRDFTNTTQASRDELWDGALDFEVVG